jgi:hypothetical protein
MSIELDTSNIDDTRDKFSSMEALQISCPCFESALNAVEKKKSPYTFLFLLFKIRNIQGDLG